VDAEIRYSTDEFIDGFFVSGVGTPKINNQGTIAFNATLDELTAPFYNGTGFMTNTGPGLTDIVARANDGTRGAISLQNFGIDSSGDVVFEDRSTSGDNRIFMAGAVGAGSEIANTGDPGETAFDYAGPSVREASSVVYMTTAPGSGFGTQTLVRDNGAGLGTPFASTSGTNIDTFIQYDTNASNDVAYVADLSGSNPTSLFVDTSPGGSTLLADDTDFINLGSVQAQVVMGGDGNVYVRDTTAGGKFGIFRVNSSGITSVVNTTDDAFSNIGFFSVNADGDIVFIGTSGGVTGLYTGANPTTDKLVEVGDTIDGIGVQFFTLSSDALNDNDQVAFGFGGTDGENHLVVGSTVPEPASALMLGLGGLLLLRRSSAQFAQRRS